MKKCRKIRLLKSLQEEILAMTGLPPIFVSEPGNSGFSRIQIPPPISFENSPEMAFLKAISGLRLVLDTHTLNQLSGAFSQLSQLGDLYKFRVATQPTETSSLKASPQHFGLR